MNEILALWVEQPDIPHLWAMGLAMVLVFGILPAVLVLLLAREGQELQRLQYFWRTLLLGLIAIVLIPTWFTINAALALDALVVALWVYWTAARFRSLERSKWLAVLIGIPVVNIVVWLLLCVWPAPRQVLEV